MEKLPHQCSMPTVSFVLVESDPVCNYSQQYFEKDLNKITTSCSVFFYGNWAPSMQWSIITSGFHLSAVDVSTNGRVSSTLTINTTAQMDGQQFKCTTYFSQPSSSLAVTAKNIPEYNSTWISNALKAFGKIYAYVSHLNRPTTKPIFEKIFLKCGSFCHHPPRTIFGIYLLDNG